MDAVEIPSANELFENYKQTYGSVMWPANIKEPSSDELKHLQSMYDNMVSDEYLTKLIKKTKDNQHLMSLLRSRWYILMRMIPSKMFVGVGEFFDYYRSTYGGPLVPVSDVMVPPHQMEHLYQIYWDIVNNPVNACLFIGAESKEQLMQRLTDLWVGTIIKLRCEGFNFGGLLASE